MKDRSRTHRGLAALATYCLTIGASLVLQQVLCARCLMDNAYMGEGLLGLVFVFMGVLFGLTWLLASRREGGRGFVAGAIPGVVFGAAIVIFGATRIFVPPALSAVELLLFAVGAALTVALSRADEQPVSPPGVANR